MRQPRILFTFATCIAFVSAVAFSHQVLYRQLTVPQLPQISHVPLWWWIAIYSPIVIVCIVAGWKAVLLTELIMLSIAAAICNHFYIFWAATNWLAAAIPKTQRS